MTRWLLFVLFAWSCFGMMGCPQKTSTGKKQTRRTPPTRRATPSAGVWAKGWLQRSWLDMAAEKPDVLKPYLGEDADEAMRKDIGALLTNGIHKALLTSKKPQSLKAEHRVIRARMHLKMARFYALLWKMAAQQQARYYKRRWSMHKKIQTGKLLRYYYGRLLCLQGKSKEGAAFLKDAVGELPENRKDRAKAWLAACQDKASFEKVAASLKFANDDDGKEELLLIHELYNIPLKKDIETSTVRGRLFEYSLRGKGMVRKPLIGGRPVDEETVKEKDTSATLRYLDVAIPRARMRTEAHSVLRFLKGLKDEFAPLLRAEAYRFLGQAEKAKAALAAYLKEPPKKMSWSYVLFSDEMTLADRQLRAELMNFSQLSASDRKKKADELVKQTKTFPGKLRVALALLRAGLHTETASKWVEQGANLVHDLKQRLNKSYRVGKKDTGSMLVRNIRLYRYAWRSGYMLASRAALKTKKPYLAANWMEILHDKDALHKIAKGNEALQILWTIRALLYKRDYRTATLYLLKNRGDYPSLDQIRSPLGLLLIIDNKGGPGVIKEGG